MSVAVRAPLALKTQEQDDFHLNVNLSGGNGGTHSAT